MDSTTTIELSRFLNWHFRLRLAAAILVFFAVALSGCASTPYSYGSAARYRSSPELAACTEVQMERGRPQKAIDTFSRCLRFSEVDFIWINRIKEQIMQTSANMQVKLGEADIAVRDLLELSPGDVIQLATDATLPLDVLVEGIAKFKGIPGILKGNRAIKITESLAD